MQILANRLSLIMYDPVKERRLKVGLLIAVGIINVSVFCIWVPARLQISETFIRVNDIWDRMEKAIFAVVDMTLNTYFMWLVKSKLVASGLTQYNILFKYNLIMVCFSISLDVSLPSARLGITTNNSRPPDFAHRAHVSTGRCGVRTSTQAPTHPLITDRPVATFKCTRWSTSQSSTLR